MRGTHSGRVPGARLDPHDSTEQLLDACHGRLVVGVMEARPDVAVQQELQDDVLIEPIEIELARFDPRRDEFAEQHPGRFERFVAVGGHGVEHRVIEAVVVELESHPVLDHRV